MKFKKRAVLGLLAMGTMASLTACGNSAETSIINGNFENGSLEGWIMEGDAFQPGGVVSEDVVEGYSVGKEGENFYNGLEACPQAFTGTMQSSTFKIDGTGYISFLLGAGKDTSKCYVAVYDADTNEEIARQSNTSFDGTFVTTHLIRYTMDLSEYKGKNAYIKVVDEDNGDSFAYLLVDDFVTYIADEETLNKYKNEQTEKLASLVPPPFEEDETSTTIQNPGFEDPNLSGWKILSGTAFNATAVANSQDKFWDVREFNAIGDQLLNGYNNAESAIGEIRSSKFTLSGDGFISFLIGGAGTENCYISINDGSTDEELIKITNSQFKDPEMSLNLSRVYVDASAYLGKVVYIKIVDNAEGGPFGSITADDFHVSMTKDEVTTLMAETYNWAMGLGDDAISGYIKNYYTTYQYPFELEILRITNRAEGQAIYTNSSVNVNEYVANVTASSGSDSNVTVAIDSITNGTDTITTNFDAVDMSKAGNYTVNYSVKHAKGTLTDSFIISVAEKNDILNADFESNNLAGWNVLTPDTMKANEAISGESVFWGEEIPYNQNGNFHFDGWAAQYAETDAYSIRSSNFTLGGSGHISFRMGGNAAAVKVFKADGTPVAVYLNSAFADVNFPNLDEGSRLATMTTFVADLSDYAGEELYIELHDLGEGPWALAFFDDIKVNYEQAPDVANMSDPVTFNKKVDETLTPTEFNIPWVQAVNAQ